MTVITEPLESAPLGKSLMQVGGLRKPGLLLAYSSLSKTASYILRSKELLNA